MPVRAVRRGAGRAWWRTCGRGVAYGSASPRRERTGSATGARRRPAHGVPQAAAGPASGARSGKIAGFPSSAAVRRPRSCFMSHVDIRSAARPDPAQPLVDIADYVIDAKIDSQEAYDTRSEAHTSELKSTLRMSYAVFCWK